MILPLLALFACEAIPVIVDTGPSGWVEDTGPGPDGDEAPVPDLNACEVSGDGAGYAGSTAVLLNGEPQDDFDTGALVGAGTFAFAAERPADSEMVLTCVSGGGTVGADGVLTGELHVRLGEGLDVREAGPYDVTGTWAGAAVTLSWVVTLEGRRTRTFSGEAALGPATR